MKKKIKVLHLISHMNDGGAQRIILNYLNDLNDDEEIEIKVLVYGEKTNSYCNKVIEKNNYNVDYMFEKIHNRYIRKLIKIFFGNMLLKRYLKKYCPDIVHVHISPFIKVCLNAIVKSSIPVRFDTLHSNPYRFKGRDLEFIRKAFQKENFIGICVTNEQVTQAVDYYGMKKYEVVYNGIDIEKIKRKIISKNDAREKLNLNKEKFIIGAIGRLDAVKRFDFLIKIFAELLKKKPNSLLLIAGEGPEKGKLVDLSKQLNVNDKVIFLGNIDNVEGFYCAIDVLTITSETESSSLVLLESQVCKTRNVISNGTPSESIVSSNVRKMSENSNVDEWVDAILDDNYYCKPYSNLYDYDVHNISNKIKSIYKKYMEEYENDRKS